MKNNNQENYDKMLFESYAGLNGSNDEQDEYNSKSGMGTVDILENILNRLTDMGITHKFQNDSLILTHTSYTMEKVIDVKDDIEAELDKVATYIKDKFKEKTGKTLTLTETGEDFSTVASYTSFKQTHVKYSKFYKFEDVFKSEIVEHPEDPEYMKRDPKLMKETTGDNIKEIITKMLGKKKADNFFLFFKDRFNRDVINDPWYAKEWAERILTGSALKSSDSETIQFLHNYKLIDGETQKTLTSLDEDLENYPIEESTNDVAYWKQYSAPPEIDDEKYIFQTMNKLVAEYEHESGKYSHESKNAIRNEIQKYKSMNSGKIDKGVIEAMVMQLGKAGKVAKTISKSDAKDFASTSTKGLPNKVKKEAKELPRLKNNIHDLSSIKRVISSIEHNDDLSKFDNSLIQQSFKYVDDLGFNVSPRWFAKLNSEMKKRGLKEAKENNKFNFFEHFIKINL